MKVEFIRRHNTDKLILIFAGWGSDTGSYRDVVMPDWDVAVVYGIDAVRPELSFLKEYSTVYLYAWSLGVWSAEHLLGEYGYQPTRAYALNGTPLPCDDERGIPRQVFVATAQGLSERNLEKFRIRMCGGRQLYEQNSYRFEQINNVKHLQEELLYVLSHTNAWHLKWDAAFISEEDRIFPPENQLRAWEKLCPVFHISGQHFVNLQTVVAQTIVDVQKVCRRFTRSLDTYNAHAHAQRLIAHRLASRMCDFMPYATGEIVEIGCGTGNFTREWSKIFVAERATFIDLCDMPSFGVAQRETYFKTDAESEMMRLAAEQPSQLTAVLSASAIQWFSNLPLFFANCARVLRPHGFIAMSTFAPGNLEELQSLRPDHLKYLTVKELREIVGRHFAYCEVEEEVVQLEFSTPLEALRHLQLTGVTASGSRQATVGELRRFSQTFPMNDRGRYTLTFRPIYILARL